VAAVAKAAARKAAERIVVMRVFMGMPLAIRRSRNADKYRLRRTRARPLTLICTGRASG
jgi:hypothetical protein